MAKREARRTGRSRTPPRRKETTRARKLSCERGESLAWSSCRAGSCTAPPSAASPPHDAHHLQLQPARVELVHLEPPLLQFQSKDHTSQMP